MTYCVGIMLDSGLIFASDTSTVIVDQNKHPRRALGRYINLKHSGQFQILIKACNAIGDQCSVLRTRGDWDLVHDCLLQNN